jgi:hypothetical protein
LGEVGEGIILEDEYLPTPAFFKYMAEMLDRYRLDPRVALILIANRSGDWHSLFD